MQPPSPIAAPDKLALLLDFDGTLVEIAPRPDAITVPTELPARLSDLHERLEGAVAVISGRSIEDVRRYLPDFPGAVIGSHGTEISLPGEPPEPVAEFEGLDELREAARNFTARDDRLLFENKTHSVVVHFRAAPELGDEVRRFMQELAERYPDFALQQAKMAWELRPAAADKGTALETLMKKPPFSGRTPVYVGDDTTDEAAMRVAARMGGTGIKIGAGDSVAQYRLPDPAALSEWLESAV